MIYDLADLPLRSDGAEGFRTLFLDMVTRPGGINIDALRTVFMNFKCRVLRELWRGVSKAS